jgi:polysaccharide biosynthesis transport protein
VILDNVARHGNGHGQRSASRNGNGQGVKLGKLTASQYGHGPGTPGSWRRFLVAHARWILAVTAAVVAAAIAFAAAQTPLYQSQADVTVEPAPAVAASGTQPDMGTEASVATSGVVLSRASKALGVPAATLSDGLSAKARGTSYVLQIMYSDPSPRIAQQRAQGIAQAYTSFRSARPSPESSTPSTAPVATLITPASLPTSPYSPDYPLDIAIALLAGLALAIATAWGRDYLDDRLRGPLDLERQADAGVLALIPAFRPDGPEPVRRLAMVISPSSTVAEAYRGLRTRVLLAAATMTARTVLVTSPAREDSGTVAANLAAALAQSGRGTVLVCADPQWGSAHLPFGTQGDGEGFTELLQQRTDLIGALRPTRVPGLLLLPPGALAPDPAALLQLPAFRTVLTEIRAQADIVVIEAPPLLISPAARLLADGTEIILLTADARTSTRAQVRAAARELEQERSRLAGCVLVSVGPRRQLRHGPDGSIVTPAGHNSAGHNSASHNSAGHSNVAVTPADHSNVVVTPAPESTLGGASSEISEERQWPNGS